MTRKLISSTIITSSKHMTKHYHQRVPLLKVIHQLVFRSNLHDIFSAPNEYTMLRLSIFCEILYTWIWGSNLQLYGKLRGKSSVHCTHTRMQHSSLSPNNIEHVNKSTNYVAFLNKPFALCNSFLLPVDPRTYYCSQLSQT